MALLMTALSGLAAGQVTLLTPAQRKALSDDAFELEIFKDRFEHEVRFRAAAIEVAWGEHVRRLQELERLQTGSPAKP